MRVYRHCRLSKCCVQNDIRGFSADSGQGFKGLAILWNLSCVPFNQQAACFDDVARLGFIQSDRLDVFGQTVKAEFEYPFGCSVAGEEFCSRDIDGFIRRLGRQHHRDQQLERVAVR